MSMPWFSQSATDPDFSGDVFDDDWAFPSKNEGLNGDRGVDGGVDQVVSLAASSTIFRGRISKTCR
jgi:hypothetical protein